MSGDRMQNSQSKNPMPKESEFSKEANIMDAMEREFRQIFCAEDNIGFAKSFQNDMEVSSKSK